MPSSMNSNSLREVRLEARSQTHPQTKHARCKPAFAAIVNHLMRCKIDANESQWMPKPSKIHHHWVESSTRQISAVNRIHRMSGSAGCSIALNDPARHDRNNARSVNERKLRSTEASASDRGNGWMELESGYGSQCTSPASTSM